MSGKREPTKVDRNLAVVKMRNQNMPIRKIASLMEISPTRVVQIIKKWKGERRHGK